MTTFSKLPTSWLRLIHDIVLVVVVVVVVAKVHSNVMMMMCMMMIAKKYVAQCLQTVVKLNLFCKIHFIAVLFPWIPQSHLNFWKFLNFIFKAWKVVENSPDLESP